MHIAKALGALGLFAVTACLENDRQASEPADETPEAQQVAAVEVRGTSQALESALCGSVAGLQANAPWPMFGGCPSHAAQSSQYGPTSSQKNWSTYLSGNIKSSPAIAADGSIFVGSDAQKLFKINRATGAIVKQASLSGDVESSPAIAADGTVYVGTDLGRVYALDPNTLATKWSYSAAGGFDSSPAIAADGTIYIGSSNFSLYAFNPNGTKKWSYLTGYPVINSPAIGSDGTIYIGSDNTLFALNPNGTKKWSKPIGSPITSSPALGRFGRVYIGGGDKLLSIDAATGNIIWQKSLGSCTIYAPAIGANGVIYAGTGFSLTTGGSLYAVSPDGEILWHFDAFGGVQSTPIIDRAGNIYFGADDNKVYAVDATGQQIWKFSTLGNVRSSPALDSTGALIVGANDNQLYSIGVGATRVQSGGACSSDAQCVPGLLCGAANGPRFGLAAGTRACWQPTCENKVQDPGETEVDCGGSCGSCSNVCSGACVAGSQVPAPALELLSFAKASFIRPSIASYQAGAQQSLAGGNVLRLEDRADGRGRLALFEGTRTNRVRFSEQLGHSPEWRMPTGGTPIVESNDYAQSPAADATADRINAPAGGYPSRTQSIDDNLPAGVLSAWLRLTDANGAAKSTRAVIADSFKRWYSSTAPWAVSGTWQRQTMTTSASTYPVELSFSHKAAWPGNATTFPQLAAADFLAWGIQLEEGTFASSYIPTTDDPETRLADRLVFESKDVPAWIRTGLWQIDAAPIFASADMATSDEMTLAAWESGQLQLARDSAGGVLKISAGSTTAKLSIDWIKDTKLTITLDFSAHTLAVRGATRGDGSVSTGNIAIPAGRVSVGAMLDGSKAAFARISEPRRVSAPSVTCVSDPDCVACGDGFVTGNERCEPVLDVACKADCSGPITNAATELSCKDLADNDSDGLIDCADVVDCNLDPSCRATAGASCAQDFDCAKNLVCAAGACRAPQCENGIKDANEQGTDCGGPCATCNGRQCSNVCRPGQDWDSAAQAYLAFSTGVFTRASTATFSGATGGLESARTNELRWVNASGRRLALFEGASTNVLAWSQALDHTPNWSLPANAPMSVTPNLSIDPTGVQTADLFSSPNGPASSPTQTVGLPGANSSLSFWLSQPTTAPSPSYEDARVFASVASGSTRTANWQLYASWDRADLALSGTQGAPTTIGFSDVAGVPNSTFGPRAATSFLAWGAQLEGQSFPTSYIPSLGAPATRAADNLTLSAVPAWLTSGRWQVDVAPLFASNELRSDWRYTLLSFASSLDIALVPGGAGMARVAIRHGGGVFNSPDLRFERNAVLTLTFDLAGDTLTIAGETTGTGTYPVSGFALNAATVRVGGALGGQNEAFAAIGEPRQVSAASSPCVADAACSCGNGVRDPGEACDPGLDAHCDRECGSSEIVTCQSDADCLGGSVCGADNGLAFNLEPGTSVCWPATLCSGAGAALHCGPGSPCGECVCAPNCALAACGASTSDGCGGRCPGVCGDQPGCARDEDCQPGYTCGEDQGGSFGWGIGSNICWPKLCEDPSYRVVHCGTPGATCGDTCTAARDECGNAECGTINGNSCGECGDGFYCDAFSQCQVAAAFTLYPPPLKGVEDVVADPPLDPAGALQGDFAVDANGAATYTIPLDVPPGPGGHAPKLALQYASTSGDGVAGKGWSLSGLSAITRCPHTFAQHGYSKGVELSENDALCLDGKLLVPVGEGNEVTHSVKYRTELDSFVAVTSIGDPWFSGSSVRFYTGPASFSVVTKEGLTLIYGGTSNARVEANFNSPTTNENHAVNVSWLLQAIADPSGNLIEVAYEDKTKLQINDFAYTAVVRPTAISYGRSNSIKVTFDYAESVTQWAVRSYRAGVGKHISSPIETITTAIDDKPVRIYRLDSQVRGSEWVLRSIYPCAPHSAGESCIPPTTFSYTPVAGDLSLLATTTDDAGYVPINPDYADRAIRRWEPENLNDFKLWVLDSDGDGREDILHTIFEGRGKYLKDYAGPTEDKSVGLDPGYSYERIAQAFDGQHAFGPLDKKDKHQGCNASYIGYFAELGRDSIYGACTPSFFLVNYLLPGDEPQSIEAFERTAVADADGDGRQDMYKCRDYDDGAGFQLELFKKKTPSEPGGWEWERGPSLALDSIGHGGPELDCAHRLVLDYDGDGAQDLILVEYDKKGHYASGYVPRLYAVSHVLDATTGEQTLVAKDIGESPLGDAGALENYRLLDANGDGLVDLVTLRSNKVPALYLSTGLGFKFADVAPHAGNYELFNRSFVMDVDSDGRDELLIPTKDGHWITHAPYTINALDGYAWTSRVAAMPYRVASVKKKGHDRYHAYGYQAPHVLDWDGDGVQEVITRRPPPADADDWTHPVFELWKAAPRTQSLLSAVVDGLGKRIDVTYDSGPDAYEPGTGCTYPQRCLKTLPHPVVSSHTVSGSAGRYQDPRGLSATTIARTSEYEYEDARADVRGRGWLGFAKRTVREFADPGRRVRSTTFTYDVSASAADFPNLPKPYAIFPFAGYPARTTVEEYTGLANELVRRTDTLNAWELRVSADQLPFVALRGTSTAEYEDAESAPDQLVSAHVENFTYDDRGNRKQTISIWSDGRVRTEFNTYIGSDDPDWEQYLAKGLVGLLSRQTISGTAPVQGAEGKQFQLEILYDETAAHDGTRGSKIRGLPTTVNRWSMVGGAPLAAEQSTRLSYDVFSNEVTRELSGSHATTQSYTTVYDDRGIAPIEIKNSLHTAANRKSTKLGVDVRSGRTQWVVRPDGSWSVVNRDAFGREVTTFDSIGTSGATHYSVNASAGGSLVVTLTGAGKPIVATEYNAFGQPIATRVTEWSPKTNAAQTRVEEIGYDRRGRKVAEGTPHLLNTASPSARYSYYDDADRLMLTAMPWVDDHGDLDYVETRHSYATPTVPSPTDDVGVPWADLPEAVHAHKVEVVAPEGAVKVEVSDPRGNVVAAIDSLGTMTRHVFGALDYPRTTQVLDDATTYVTDDFGNVTTVTDPDIGTQTYAYDGLGLMYAQTRNGKATTYHYDALGRKDRVESPDGIYTFAYDGTIAEPSALGHLTKQTLASASVGNSSVAYEYDNPGATVSAIRRTFQGEQGTFDTLIEPDGLGRMGIIRYPAPADRPLAVRFHYEENYGRLDAVVEEGTGRELWKLLAIDAFGNGTELSYANGQKVTRAYQPATGRAASTAVEDATHSNVLTTSVTFDQRGLLATRTTKRASESASTETFQHDALARLKRRTLGDGTQEQYDYDLNGNLTLSPTAGTLSYEGPKPHQVTSTTPWVDPISHVSHGEARTFGYSEANGQNNGNQTTRSGQGIPGGAQRIQYAAFDLPHTVESGPAATPDAPETTTRFQYDASNKRIVQTTTNNGVAAGQPGHETRLLYAGDLYRRKSVTGAHDEHTVRIPTPDGLVIEATLKAVTPGEPSNHEYRFLQTDYLGSVLGVSAEDGSHIASAAYTPFGEPSAPLDSWGGFGGFEEDSDLGLVNMRGRIYDPHLGRFLSPDPVVADPLASQSWNRYSYVSNSPLNAIDPSGFEEDWMVGLSFGTQPITIWPSGTTIWNASIGMSWAGSDPFAAIVSLSINSGAGSSQMDMLSVSFGSNYASQTPAFQLHFTDLALAVGDELVGAYRAYQAWAAGIGAEGYEQSTSGNMSYAKVQSNASLELLNHFVEATPTVSSLMITSAAFSAAPSVTAVNEVPSALARVIPGKGSFPTLGPPFRADVFVTAADDIAGMNAAQIAEKLSIPKSPSFTVIEFTTPSEGLASPILRTDQGFVGRGFTAGGAREFVLPNGPVPAGAT